MNTNNDCLPDNAVAKLDDYRVQVIVKLIDSPVLRRLDKITCTSTERREAREWIEEMEGEDEAEEEEEDVEEEEVVSIYNIFTQSHTHYHSYGVLLGLLTFLHLILFSWSVMFWFFVFLWVLFHVGARSSSQM